MDRISYNQRLHKAQMDIIAAVEVLVGTTQGLTLPAASKRDAEHRNLMSWEHLAAWLTERAADFTADGYGAGDEQDASVSDGLDDETSALDTLSLADLRDLADAAGIEVSGRRKADYIEALQAHGAQ